MLIIDSTPVAVKPAPTFAFQAFRTELDAIEADAREMGESLLMDDMFDAMTDAEIEMMAGEAAYAASIDDAEMPW